MCGGSQHTSTCIRGKGGTIEDFQPIVTHEARDSDFVLNVKLVCDSKELKHSLLISCFVFHRKFLNIVLTTSIYRLATSHIFLNKIFFYAYKCVTSFNIARP